MNERQEQPLGFERPERARSRRGRRRQRKAERHDPRRFSDLLVGDASGPETIRSLIGLVDSVLSIVERTAWELREVAETAGAGYRNITESTVAGYRQVVESAGGSEVVEGAGGPEVSSDEGELGRAAARAPLRFKRLASTAWMLAQLAMTYRGHAFRSAFVSRESAAADLDKLHAKNARRFYETSVEQGGALLKVGQLLSARHDLLPPAWISELSKLQDEVPALPPGTARAVVEAEFGKPLEQLFEVFDEQPVAAASIGQVHRARTPSGEWVAVKVQRPGISELIDTDLELLGMFIQSIRSMLPPADYAMIEREISSTVKGETDYVLEARMMGLIAAFFAGHPAIRVPEPVPDLCGRRVLTSRFVDARKISDFLGDCAKRRDSGDREAGRRLDRVMSLLLEAYVRMVLEAGVFQADPHPGNLLVTADDELVVLDFGATKVLPPKVREGYLAVVRAFIFGDRQRLAVLLDELGFRTASGQPETLLMFAEILLQTMRQAIEGGGGFAWPTKQELLSQASELLRQVERDPVVSLPAEFVMTARVFGTLGGLFMHYRPNIDYTKALLPIIGQALAQPS